VGGAEAVDGRTAHLNASIGVMCPSLPGWGAAAQDKNHLSRRSDMTWRREPALPTSLNPCA